MHLLKKVNAYFYKKVIDICIENHRLGDMTKVFKDQIETSREPARCLGKWDEYTAFESTSIYFTHLVRLEKGKKVEFLYDPGKVSRYAKIKDYPIR